MNKSTLFFLLAMFVGIMEHETLIGQLLIGVTCVALLVGAVVTQEETHD